MYSFGFIAAFNVLFLGGWGVFQHIAFFESVYN